MKLYLEMIRALFNKVIFRENKGTIIKNFSESMGIVYIKLAQILATQNYGNLFTEEDREKLSSICDNCKPISYKKIERVLKKEYGSDLKKIFKYIDKKPVGSASVSQVHRGILVNGDVVAIKIKRKDITNNIDKDIEKIRKLIHRYGKLFHFGNFKGADLALDLYLDWILDEIDFDKEKENIKVYSKYVDSVNGRVSLANDLRVPRVYEEYSTSNVIVMEFVKTKTINKMDLTEENKKKIVSALNSYIQLNFWAMFNDKPIAFHGDPHSANLSIDEYGNLWFLDMGLLFVLSEDESKLCRNFFLAIYMGNYEKLYEMLIIYSNLNDKQRKKFKGDIKKYIDDVRDRNVTHYFIDLIGICLKFEFVPPAFLVNMAKAFICVYGISNFSSNNVGARDLLKNQVALFMVKRSINDFTDILVSSLNIIPDVLGSISKTDNSDLKDNINKSFDDFKEVLDLLKGGLHF